MGSDPMTEKTQSSIASETAAARCDERLLALLVCPLTKTTLNYCAETQELFSRAAGLAFPIRNGVPLMIADAARPLTDADLKRISHA